MPAREEVRLCYPNTFILSISPAPFFRGVIQVLKLASPVNTQCADGTNSGSCFTSGEVGFAVFSCSQMVQTVRFILSRQIGAVTCSANISVKNPWCAAFNAKQILARSSLYRQAGRKSKHTLLILIYTLCCHKLSPNIM